MATKTFEMESEVGVSAEDLFAWHMRLGALARLSPPWQPVELMSAARPPVVGDRVTLKLGTAPMRVRWVASHTEVEEGRGFEDTQIEGPFKSWRHRHRFEPSGDSISVLRDTIDYELPLGIAGDLMADGFVRQSLERTFSYRHATTQRDLGFHRRYTKHGKQRIAVTGPSGLIGSALCAFLSTGGHEVVPVVRRRVARSDRAARWAPEVGVLDPGKLEGLDAVVHLAGESIGDGRWTTAKKSRIRSSRLEGTRRLMRSLAELDRPPGTIICASAVGFYGDCKEDPVDESRSAGDGFLASLCQEWEQVAMDEALPSARVVSARFGVVLSPKGGALAKMLPAFRWGGGGRIGDGRQFMSWIGIDDVVGSLTHLILTPGVSGPVNIVAPNPVRNSEFTRTLCRILRRPGVATMPAALARTLFGEMADEALLVSTRVESARLASSGYEFFDPTLEPTLRRLLGYLS